MIDRKAVYNKYNGLCAYSGTPLENDWQIEHVVPISRGGTDDINNLLPVQKIINHYKRALMIGEFKRWYLSGLHERLKKLPKNPRVEKSKKRKDYMLKIASYFNIKIDHPFSGKLYFELINETIR